jgi:phosphate transport system permease protein
VIGAAAVLGMILAVIFWRGIGALSIEMITQPPRGSFYLGGGGGIANAIAGSLLLALGATAVAICLAVPLVLYLHAYAGRSRFADWLRLTLDIMWGIPSIVYGAFGFSLMIFLGLRASLLAGVIALSFVVLPILARTFDEVVSMAPKQLQETGFALGTTRLEMAGLLLRQSLPGLFTAILLAFGRGIGDAAAVLFTAGYTDNMPSSLLAAGGFAAAGRLLSVGHALPIGASTRLCLGAGAHGRSSWSSAWSPIFRCGGWGSMW